MTNQGARWIAVLGLVLIPSVSLHGEEIQVPSGETPDQYTVQEGDTLWGISDAILKDPFLWPKVWRENPSIPNPDRIFPGGRIRLPGYQEPEVEPGESAMTSPSASDEKTEPEAPPTQLTPSRPADALQDPFHLMKLGAILPGALGAEGVVVGREDERQMFGTGDQIYLRPTGNPFEPGEHRFIFRFIRNVYHPLTGRYLGKLVRILGEAKILKLQEGFALAEVIRSADVIQPGDSLLPIPEEAEAAAGTAPEGLTGVVVATPDERIGSASLDVVYIDLGKEDGIGPGDRFSILRAGRKASVSQIESVRLPSRQIGELQVVKSQEHTSTAVILRSDEPVFRGDRLLVHLQNP
jgi:hypothetical protein